MLGMFFVLGSASDRSFRSRPKLPVGNFVEQGSGIPIRHRHPAHADVKDSAGFPQGGMAVPEEIFFDPDRSG